MRLGAHAQSSNLANNSRRRAWCAHAASEWATMAQPTSGASTSPAGCRCRTAVPASTTARSTINGRLAGDASSGEGCSGGGGGSLGSGSCGGGEGSGGYHKDPGSLAERALTQNFPRLRRANSMAPCGAAHLCRGEARGKKPVRISSSPNRTAAQALTQLSSR